MTIPTHLLNISHTTDLKIKLIAYPSTPAPLLHVQLRSVVLVTRTRNQYKLPWGPPFLCHWLPVLLIQLCFPSTLSCVLFCCCHHHHFSPRMLQWASWEPRVAFELSFLRSTSCSTDRVIILPQGSGQATSQVKLPTEVQILHHSETQDPCDRASSRLPRASPSPGSPHSSHGLLSVPWNQLVLWGPKLQLWIVSEELFSRHTHWDEYHQKDTQWHRYPHTLQAAAAWKATCSLDDPTTPLLDRCPRETKAPVHATT